MRCPYCHATINDLEEYCPKCGNLLPLPYCVNCGAPLERGDVFCPKCGAEQGVPLDPVQIEPADATQDEQPRKEQSQDRQDRYEPDDYDGYEEEDLEDEDDFEDEEDADDWDDDDESGVRWAPLIVVVIIAAVVVIVFAAWRFGILDNLFGEREETAVVAEEEETAEAEDETPHVLNFVTQTLEFNDPGLTSRIYFDTDIEDQSEIEWTSSDTAVATVDGNGYVTSVGAGRAIVTAKWGDLSASCNVACDYTNEDQYEQDIEEEEVTEPEETPEEEDNEEQEEEEAETIVTAGGDYLCSFSSDRLITQADMAALSSSDYGSLPAGRSLAQMMINEIYARHGYQFETEAIQQYFDQKDWYKAIGSYSPDSTVIMNRMNDIEKQNISFLNNY